MKTITIIRIRTLLLLLLTTLLGTTSVKAQEAYAQFVNNTLMFYYDKLRSTRIGTTYDLNTDDTNIPQWLTYRKSVKSVVFDASFAGARPTSTYYWFQQMSSLESITGLENLNTSEVLYMDYMFQGCALLESLDLSHFDTSKVTDMFAMFDSCKELKSVNLSNWNTSSVKSMKQMFSGCSSLAALDLRSFNTSAVTDMSYMFYNTSMTTLDLSNFDTRKVNNMSRMFSGCASLETIYAGGYWNMDKVPDQYSGEMFLGCTSLVGGAGTTYDAGHANGEYGRIDGGPTSAAPGYLTAVPYTMYSSGAISVELSFDTEEGVYKGSLFMQKGEDVFFQDNNGKIYVAQTNNQIVNANHNTNLPVVESGSNFILDATGTFIFKLKVTPDSKSLTVVPASGFWPPVTATYYLCYNVNGGEEYVPFTETELGKYELRHALPARVDEFWFSRRLEGSRLYFGCNDQMDANDRTLNRYNSKDLTLYSSGWDTFMLNTDGEVVFNIADLNNGLAPKLSITGWPPSRIDFVYDLTQSGALTYDEATDTYSIVKTVTKDKTLYFLDVTVLRPLMVDADEDLTLSRLTSNNVALSAYPTNNGGFIQMKHDGTYTFKVKLTDEGALLNVVWPDPVFSTTITDDTNFVRQDDGSYTKEVTIVPEQMQGHNGYQFSIVEKSSGSWEYYGIPSMTLTRKNTQNLELGEGSGYFNIQLFKVGTYTLTISPDLKLSIGWQEPDYHLCVKADEQNTRSVPFVYDPGTETYSIEQLSIESGSSVYIMDNNTGQGYGLPSIQGTLLTKELAKNGFAFYPDENMPKVQTSGNFSFTMREQDNGTGLDISMTGWPAPYYVYDYENDQNVATFLDNNDGTYSCELEVTDAMIDTNYFRFDISDDSEHYYFSGNSSNFIVTGNSTTFQLMLAEPGVSGYPIHVQAGQYKLTFNPTTLTLTVKNNLPGDVNADRMVTEADVPALVNIILGKSTSSDQWGDAYVTCNITAKPANEYEAGRITLEGKALAAVMSAFRLTPAQIAERMEKNNVNYAQTNGKIRLYAVDAGGNVLTDRSETSDSYGYWYNASCNVCLWGDSNAMFGSSISAAELKKGKITLIVYQYPNRNQSGDTYKIRQALRYITDSGQVATVWFTVNIRFDASVNEGTGSLSHVQMNQSVADLNHDGLITVADVTNLVNTLQQ